MSEIAGEFTRDGGKYIDLAAVTRVVNRQVTSGISAAQARAVLAPAYSLINKAVTDGAALDLPGQTKRVKVQQEIAGLINDLIPASDAEYFTDVSGWSALYLRRVLISASVEANVIVSADLADKLPDTSTYLGLVSDLGRETARIVVQAARTVADVVAQVPTKIADFIPWWVYAVAGLSLAGGVFLAVRR